MGYSGIHERLRKAHPYTGTCQLCGVSDERRTEYAFLRHPEPYTERREDYAEAHRVCHNRMDRGCA